MKKINLYNNFLLLIFFVFITSCSGNSAMKPEDFKDQKPRLIIEDYLTGAVKRKRLEKRMLEGSLEEEYLKPVSGKPFKINE